MVIYDGTQTLDLIINDVAQAMHIGAILTAEKQEKNFYELGINHARLIIL